VFSSVQEDKRRSQGLPPSPGCCGGISDAQERKQQQAIAREQLICHLRAEQDREERMQEYILRKRKEEAEDLMTGEAAAAKISGAPPAPAVPAATPVPAPPIPPLAQYPGTQPVFVGRAPYGQGMCQAMRPYQMPNSNAPYAGSPVFYL
jgi:hypothetical protein